MTRDEAIELFQEVTYPKSEPFRNDASDRKWSERAIAGFIALGMFKPEPTKTIEQRVITAVRGCRKLDDIAPIAILDCIEGAGLKIVAK